MDSSPETGDRNPDIPELLGICSTWQDLRHVTG
jgi:hypothetical protein